MTVEEEVDRFVEWHAPRILREGTAWEAGFTRSILRMSRRQGWMPSAKQLAAMRRIVAERAQPTEAEVIADD